MMDTEKNIAELYDELNNGSREDFVSACVCEFLDAGETEDIEQVSRLAGELWDLKNTTRKDGDNDQN